MYTVDNVDEQQYCKKYNSFLEPLTLSTGDHNGARKPQVGLADHEKKAHWVLRTYLSPWRSLWPWPWRIMVKINLDPCFLVSMTYVILGHHFLHDLERVLVKVMSLNPSFWLVPPFPIPYETRSDYWSEGPTFVLPAFCPWLWRVIVKIMGQNSSTWPVV